MKYCPNCGAQTADTAAFCSNCGVRLEQSNGGDPSYPPQNAQQYDPRFAPPYGQQPYERQSAPSASQDTGRLIYGVIGFFIPVVGLILYVFWKNERPLDAKRAGRGALISVILSVLFSIAGAILAFVLAANGVIDGDINYNFSLLSILFSTIL